ncbi:MAG: hypothetical protein ACOX1L_04350 [Erysipelotrichaceae bacterium]|jgi:hypothetical protein
MKENEFMSKQSMLNCGIDIIIKYLQKEGYKIEGVNNGLIVYPNVVASKDGKLYGILVEVNEVRKQPNIAITSKFNMLRLARRFNAIPLYASVGIGAVNHERFDKEILLENDPDGYLVNFEGFEEISISNIPNKDSKEYIEYVINILGTSYEIKDISILEPFLSDDIKWDSFYSENSYKEKEEVLEYYTKKFELIKDNTINYFLIEFIGSWSEFNVSEIILPDGTINHNVKVIMPQPDGEIGLIIEQSKSNNEKVGMSMIVSFDDRKINKIYIGNPNTMKFKDYKSSL